MRHRTIVIFAGIIGLSGCAGTNETSGTGASNSGGSSSASSSGPSGGGGSDAGSADLCGSAEALCNGDTVDCTSLATSYAGGSAVCRADCRGYDVTACQLASPVQTEHVKPAVRDARWNDARCSKEGEYWFEIVLTGSKQWHLQIEGGGWCTPTGVVPCFARPDQLTKDVQVKQVGGMPTFVKVQDGELVAPISDKDLPAPFAGANHVRMQYCSNDVWTGTRTMPLDVPANAQGSTTMPFVFTGRINVAATLAILQQRFGLDDLDPATEVFVTGHSAGGHGVLHNADQIAAAYPNALAAGHLHGASLSGVVPKGWGAADASVPGDWSIWDDVAMMHTGLYFDTAASTLQGVYGSRFNPLCEAAHPNDSAMCIFGNVSMPFIVNPSPQGLGFPVAVAQNRIDPLYQGFHGITVKLNGMAAFAPNGGQQASDAWGQVLTAELTGMPWLYAPMHPLAHHGIDFADVPIDTSIPTFGTLMDSFIVSASPAPFSHVFNQFTQ